MEIEVAQNKLAKALTNVSRVATSRATLPVLSNILIKVKDKKVSLITTNLDMATVDYLPVSSSADGVVTVPARLITDFVSTLPSSAPIKLTADGPKIKITAGKYSSTINGAPADDFPELPEINESTAVVFKIGIEDFKSSINQVIVAASNDFNRPALTGVHFYTKDKTLCIGATDGYRLARKKLIKDVKSEVKVTIPSATLQEVLHSIDEHMEEVEISFNEDLVRFRLGEIEIISKLIDAEYPNIDHLVPTDFGINLTTDRDELLRVAKLANLFARHGANGVVSCEAHKEGGFSVRSIANEYGENDSTVDADVDQDGKILVPAKYLISAINNINSKNIIISFSDGILKSTGVSSPMALKEENSDDYVHIIMPVSES